MEKISFCRSAGSNQGPLDLQSNALPTELFRHAQSPVSLLRAYFLTVSETEDEDLASSRSLGGGDPVGTSSPECDGRVCPHGKAGAKAVGKTARTHGPAAEWRPVHRPLSHDLRFCFCRAQGGKITGELRTVILDILSRKVPV
ncbi:hypothetical protein CDAR_521181 [Caerostris darwini]|uniref:Uncharacterized protein n=1 Tax=Caerostris darwini TaxID=1538125 RepID=A0AAV4V9V4_9ARAC|nr:hypothetical protein CDAR_521181 [Caerostris darwini]